MKNGKGAFVSGDKKGFSPYLGLTFLIGFGFFTMGLMDILYDTYVPIFLGDLFARMHVESNALIGFIMTLDNILAIFLIPIVAVWSDNTRTRIGRRMPFIVVLLPLSAVCFSLIPYAAAVSLLDILLVIFGLNIFKQAARGPVVALMPDTIPGEFRSEANGIINTMGALGAIVSTIGLARLMDLDVNLPLLGNTKDRIPFPIAGFFVIVATILLFCLVRERSRDDSAREERVPLVESLKSIAGERDKSALWILVSLFCWFLGYQGILPFVGKLSIEVFGMTKGKAALPAAAVGLAQAVFAIPSGYVAHRVGRRKSIRIALLALVVILSAAGFLASPAAAALGKARFFVFLGSMIVYGMFWITIITNSFPMLWQMATFGTMGVYTGLYYTFSQGAAISSPPVTGLIIDFAGYPGIFAFAAACMLAAFFFMGKVTRGEPSGRPSGEKPASAAEA
jgi:maltose/moltooligosaccharide transporter